MVETLKAVQSPVRRTFFHSLIKKFYANFNADYDISANSSHRTRLRVSTTKPFSSSSVSLEGVPFSSPSGPAPANLLEAGAPLARRHGKPCGTGKKISLGAPSTTYLLCEK